jgi:8-oxo-dGTP pyrophosphatase MutT (NUDIX family)
MITQYGVLAYRMSEGGEPMILLVTSRETRRWVIPRGNPVVGLPPPLSAAEEAWEEAGVKGETSFQEIGSYRYRKRRRFGSVPAEVFVYPFRVTEELDEWPEQSERERRWFRRAEAAEAVEEADLADLISAFNPRLGEG